VSTAKLLSLLFCPAASDFFQTTITHWAKDAPFSISIKVHCCGTRRMKNSLDGSLTTYRMIAKYVIVRSKPNTIANIKGSCHLASSSPVRKDILQRIVALQVCRLLKSLDIRSWHSRTDTCATTGSCPDVALLCFVCATVAQWMRLTLRCQLRICRLSAHISPARRFLWPFRANIGVLWRRKVRQSPPTA
jgi:hypothetical protein